MEARNQLETTGILSVTPGATSAERSMADIHRIVRIYRTACPRIRSRLARAAGKYLDYKAFVQKRLEDPDPRVRANVVESVWKIDSDAARKILRAAAGDRHPRVRSNALFGLYLSGDPTASDTLLKQAKHPRPDFRISAAWAMGETNDNRFCDALEALREDPDVSVRERAGASLAKILCAHENPGESDDSHEGDGATNGG